MESLSRIGYRGRQLFAASIEIDDRASIDPASETSSIERDTVSCGGGAFDDGNNDNANRRGKLI
jgi:hypothetical protein